MQTLRGRATARETNAKRRRYWVATSVLAASALVASVAWATITHADNVVIDVGSGTGNLRVGSNGGVIYDHSTGVFTLGHTSGASINIDDSITLDSDVFIDERPTIRSLSSYTAGIWYADSDGSQRQFVGTKVHSPYKALQEWGIWLGGGSGSWMYYFDGDNHAYKYGSSSWNVISDLRTKRNVADFTDGLATLEQIHPVWFEYNGVGDSPKDGKKHVGLIAQEVETKAPYMVGKTSGLVDPKDSKSNLKTVDTAPLTYILVNAVKELAEQNRQLKKELASIKSALAGAKSP